jgi:enamine deaminase RidA (YjgF/YER057c/UK114 family)
MSAYDKLMRLGIDLPRASVPAGAYASFSKSGHLLFVSGHLAKKAGEPWVGQLGENVDLGEGKAAARAVAIDLIATLHAATGNLNHVTRIVKITSLVNSTSRFTDQHLVTNGASELLAEVFGGLHARSAFGVTQLPMGVCVEIEMIAEVSK